MCVCVGGGWLGIGAEAQEEFAKWRVGSGRQFLKSFHKLFSPLTFTKNGHQPERILLHFSDKELEAPERE